MTKSIHTLVEDINNVILGKGGWDATVNEYFKETLGEAATRRLSSSKEERKPTLRMSNIGTPCKRKLWYHLNLEEPQEELPVHTQMNFFFGDMIEGLLLSLAKAAGHNVTGEQDEVTAYGIVGHRDAVIDGVVVDVKSASTRGFDKFKYNQLRIDDPFGYIQQLTGYVHAAKEDPLVTDKKGGAFLVMDKQFGHICLDYYDLTPELSLLEKHINECKVFATIPVPPHRGFDPIPDGKSGNMKLAAGCSYCPYKEVCWPEARKFIYSSGPVWLTKVVRTPNVKEITNES